MRRIADEEVDPNRARLKVDLRRWVASKFNASLYGDKLDVNVNQTVDIGAALLEARRRARDVIETESVNLLESKSNTTGLEPVEGIDTLENESEDIFS
jgi:hypothetical protein